MSTSPLFWTSALDFKTNELAYFNMSTYDHIHSKQDNFVATSCSECLHNTNVSQNCLNIFSQSRKIYIYIALLVINP